MIIPGSLQEHDSSSVSAFTSSTAGNEEQPGLTATVSTTTTTPPQPSPQPQNTRGPSQRMPPLLQ
jgi:hypothetical protein